jgi:hypothetical protein
MALGTTVTFTDKADQDAIRQAVRPMQAASGWLTVIDAAGMDDADNAGSDITTPTSQITLSTRKLVRVDGRGTTLLVRMAYDSGNAPSTDPVIQIFGRRDSSDAWMRLLNKNATPAYSVTMVDAAGTDVLDGSYKYTAVSPTDTAFDLMGCDELLFGVKTAGQGTGIALAFLQAKVI